MFYFNVTSENVNTTAPSVLDAFTSVIQRPEPRAFSYAHDGQNRMQRAMGIVVPSADTAQRVVRSLGIEHVIPKLQYADVDDVTNGFTMTAKGEAADELFAALDALDAWFFAGVHSITAFCIRTHDTPLFSVVWNATDYTLTPAEKKAERENCKTINLEWIDFQRIEKQRRRRILNRYRGDVRVIDGVDYSVISGYALRGRMQILATENTYRIAARNVGND
jgi:hypothetical protein